MQSKIKVSGFTKEESHTLLHFIEEHFESYKGNFKNRDFKENISYIGKNACKGKYYNFLDKLKGSDTRIKDLYEGFELTTACQKCLIKWGGYI